MTTAIAAGSAVGSAGAGVLVDHVSVGSAFAAAAAVAGVGGAIVVLRRETLYSSRSASVGA